MSACAGFLGLGGDSWKEEVLLHDGQKIIVERSQSYGGRHEVGQALPIKEHKITFALPNSSKTITWASEYGEDIGRTNFNLLAVHVLNDTPYVVASPNLCLSYNKWGRPNPPYVFFKYDGKEWQRVSLDEFPVEFKTANIDFGMTWAIRDRKVKFDRGDLLFAETVRRHNEEGRQPEYKTLMREAVKGGDGSSVNCEKLIPYGKGGWLGFDWFTDQPSLEACLKFCDQKKVNAESCPCNSIFKGTE
ncbi:MAG: hypothetical protein IPM27_01230 [Nitrosomonadales bacterium]|nr:hypothetical protein [Nitrosomonadales bacterium]